MPFSIFFTVPSLATSDLMRLAANRFYQYNLADVKIRGQSFERLRRAEARFAQAHASAVQAVEAGHRPGGKSLASLKHKRDWLRDA